MIYNIVFMWIRYKRQKKDTFKKVSGSEEGT